MCVCANRLCLPSCYTIIEAIIRGTRQIAYRVSRLSAVKSQIRSFVVERNYIAPRIFIQSRVERKETIGRGGADEMEVERERLKYVPPVIKSFDKLYDRKPVEVGPLP